MSKQTTNMARTIGEIQRIARLINADWFNSELDMDSCIFTVQSTPKAYGHFTPYLSYRIHSVSGEKSAVEINLGAATLDRPIENVIATLIHEMTHWSNWIHGIKDCSRGNTYHNKAFKSEAEKHGLIAEYNSIIGWSITSPSEQLIEWIIANKLEDFRLGRNEVTTLLIGRTSSNGNNGISIINVPKKSNSIKMVCPCCGNIARVTKHTNLICGDCLMKLIEAA